MSHLNPYPVLHCTVPFVHSIHFQPVSGTATVLVAPGKKVDHLGIKAELIGQIGELRSEYVGDTTRKGMGVLTTCCEIDLYGFP